MSGYTACALNEIRKTHKELKQYVKFSVGELERKRPARIPSRIRCNYEDHKGMGRKAAGQTHQMQDMIKLRFISLEITVAF
jgi:hypothetical protein